MEVDSSESLVSTEKREQGGCETLSVLFGEVGEMMKKNGL